jgi:NAD(P)-dependent dehydrogenase (short-subunit alcohol dehydrogenase family)
MVASNASLQAKAIDYDYLRTPIPNDGSRVRDLIGAFQRYSISKLSNVYYAKQLDKKLQAEGITNIYVNALHPGMSSTTGLGTGQMDPLPRGSEVILRKTLNLFSSSSADCAKTQTYLAASKAVREKNVHGEVWAPKISMFAKYQSCDKNAALETAAKDEAAAQKLWEVTEKVLNGEEI